MVKSLSKVGPEAKVKAKKDSEKGGGKTAYHQKAAASVATTTDAIVSDEGEESEEKQKECGGKVLRTSDFGHFHPRFTVIFNSLAFLFLLVLLTIWALVLRRWTVYYFGLTLAVAGMALNIALFYLDMAREGFYTSDAFLAYIVSNSFINGAGGLAFVATDLALPAQSLRQVSELGGMISNATSPADKSKVLGLLTSGAFEQRVLTTPAAIALTVFFISLLAYGLLHLYLLIWTRSHRLEPNNNRCQHIQANAKDGNFVQYCIWGHGSALSALFLIVLSASNLAKCTAGQIQDASSKIAYLRAGKQGTGYGVWDTWTESLFEGDTVMQIATAMATSECSASGQASNMLSFFVFCTLFFQGFVLDKKLATVASILDNKAHPLIMTAALAIGSSSSFAVIVLLLELMAFGAGAAWAKDISIWSSTL